MGYTGLLLAPPKLLSLKMAVRLKKCAKWSIQSLYRLFEGLLFGNCIYLIVYFAVSLQHKKELLLNKQNWISPFPYFPIGILVHNCQSLHLIRILPLASLVKQRTEKLHHKNHKEGNNEVSFNCETLKKISYSKFYVNNNYTRTYLQWTKVVIQLFLII